MKRLIETRARVGLALALLAALLLSGTVPARAQTAPPPPTTTPTYPTATPFPTSTPGPYGYPATTPLPTGSPTATPTPWPWGTTPVTPPLPPPHTGHPAGSPFTGVPVGAPPPITFADPAITQTAGIWLGAIVRYSNIRTGPGTEYPVNRAWPAGRRVLIYATVQSSTGEAWYQVEHYPNPNLYVWAPLVRRIAPLDVPPVQHTGPWVDVNLTQQTLIAFEGATPVLATQISSGEAGHETPVGSWRIYWRLTSQAMDGGNASADTYYNLAAVPWVQYFQYEGDALHGTYWHDNFGTPMSHGCVNLTYQDSNWLFDWATLGTPVEVHY